MLSDYLTHIRIGAHVAIRLPSGNLKIVEMKAKQTISLGKFGSFNSSLLIGKPYYLTFDILDQGTLEVVTAEELNAELLFTETINQTETIAQDGTEYQPSSEVEPAIVVKNNRLTTDNSSHQALSTEDIEELKKTLTGKETIAKIMASHSAIDQKTAYSLAKYALRKQKKFMPRFTVLPMDTRILIEYVWEKEPPKIMHLREEAIALLMSWANVHHAGEERLGDIPSLGGGRWLVVDDASGLIVAAMAEKMGILYPRTENDDPIPQPPENSHPRELHQMAATNSITIVHSAAQPNMSLTRYFGYNPEDPSPEHPMFRHIHTLTWLQAVDPESDTTYSEPLETATEEELATWRSSRKSAYYRKRRRWFKTQRIVNEVKQGGYDGLVVASWMEPSDVLKHLVPMVRGGGQVVVYSPTIEPLTQLADLYSRERKAAYIQEKRAGEGGDLNKEDFPNDPTLLLGPTLHTARAVEWQVLPNRTHPLMTMDGGCEGYIFAATRVLPASAEVNGKGRFAKKRKADVSITQTDRTKKLKSEEPEASSNQ